MCLNANFRMPGHAAEMPTDCSKIYILPDLNQGIVAPGRSWVDLEATE